MYLDSSNLTDLRKLFDQGVAQSETLVLIASASVLRCSIFSLLPPFRTSSSSSTSSPWAWPHCFSLHQVLHSPWCLLEIWYAHLLDIPVIIVAKPGFSLDGARGFINNLETELDIVNAGALDEVMRQVRCIDGPFGAISAALCATVASSIAAGDGYAPG